MKLTWVKNKPVSIRFPYDPFSDFNPYPYSFPWNPAQQTQAIKIRDGTKYEEIVGVRRYWKHLLRGYTNLTIYYDLTLMELGEFMGVQKY